MRSRSQDFGKNEKGAYQYGINVDKSARIVIGDAAEVTTPLPFGDDDEEEAS